MEEITIPVLDKGFVTLVNYLGNDLTVVNTARVSFGKKRYEIDDNDIKLIYYLAKHKHMSPFRHVQLQFRWKAPEFVMRQAYKHNVGIGWTDMRIPDLPWNEISGRYTQYKSEFYIPKEFRKQSKDNKQASTNEIFKNIEHHKCMNIYNDSLCYIYKAYQKLLDIGVAKEQARVILPLSIYTEVIMTTSLEGICNFIRLRNHPGAQFEITEYAKVFSELIKLVAPISMKALDV